MSQSVNTQPIEKDFSKIEKQFYQDLLQNNEQVINSCQVKHHCNKHLTTLQYNVYIFKEHSGDKKTTLYYEYVCKSRDSGCGCKLFYYPQFNKWTQGYEHSHAPPRYYYDSKQVIRLCTERRRELFDWIYAHPPYHDLNSNSVATELNSKLSDIHKGNPSYEVKNYHVDSAKHKIIQMDSLIDFEELGKEPFNQTLENSETFLRKFELSPSFRMYFASPSQIAVLNGVTECDQLCLDVSYEDCPSGITQFITLIVKKPNLDAYPVFFGFTRLKDENTYRKVWKFIQKLSPSLKTIPNLCIRIEQIEECVYRATKEMFPNNEIIVNSLNWTRSINRWIETHRTPYEPILDPMIQEKLQNDLKLLCETENSELFLKLCDNFDRYYHSFDRDFINYMDKMYLRSESVFPPKMWAVSQQQNVAQKIQTLNSSLKQYQKRVSSWFKTRPPLKKSILILQRVEYLSSIGKLYESDGYLIPSKVDEMLKN